MEFLSFPWEILPFKWSSPTNGSVKDGFPIVIYYPWQAATLPPNQPPFTIIQPSLQGKRRLARTPSFWSSVPKGNSSKQTSINWNADIYQVLWTEDSTAPTVIRETNTGITCAPVTRKFSNVVYTWTLYMPTHGQSPPQTQPIRLSKTCFLSSKDPPVNLLPGRQWKKKIIFTKNKMGQNMTVSKLSKLDALQSFLGILGDWSQDPRGYPNPWVLKSLK